MSRGSFYTKEEDERLLALCKDNEGKKLIDIANMAKRYGLCAERDARALSQHISKLLESPSDDELKDVDPSTAFWESVAAKYGDAYHSLLKTVVWTASLYKGKNHNSLTLDYRAILKYLWETEPEYMNARIEALETIDELGI